MLSYSGSLLLRIKRLWKSPRKIERFCLYFSSLAFIGGRTQVKTELVQGGSHRMITKFQSDWPTLEDKWKGGHSLDEIPLNWMVQSQDKPWPFHCLLWRKVPFPTAWEYQCSGNKIEVTTDSIKEMSWEKGWDLERTRFKHWIEACLEDLPINFHVPSIILLTITGRLKIPN